MVGESKAEAPGGKSPGRRSRWWNGRVLYGLIPLAGLQLVGLPLGCGPSIQPIHEGGVRFEHCYRLDLDPKIAPPHRHACWKQWLEVYSYGQSRDRIEYSRRRVRDLEAGDPNPPQLNLDQAEAREARQFYMATPAPTSVHAPPPPVATPEPTEALAPGDVCVANCRTTRAQCFARCGQPPDGPPAATPSASAAPTTAPPAPQQSTKPAATPDASPAKPKPGGEAGEESAVSECDCERDYKMCGVRCFE